MSGAAANPRSISGRGAHRDCQLLPNVVTNCTTQLADAPRRNSLVATVLRPAGSSGFGGALDLTAGSKRENHAPGPRTGGTGDATHPGHSGEWTSAPLP